MKSYTDLEQSKKLAEILPLESADMRYTPFGDTHPWVWNEEVKLLEKGSVPCWSLAALLGVLPPYLYEWEKGIDFNLYPSVTKKRWWCAGYISQDLSPDKDRFTLITHADNPVDACYEMIIKLKENNLL